MKEVLKTLKSYKTEINPTEFQKSKIKQTIGVARYVKNLYISHNKENYEKGDSFIGGMSFSKWLNNEFIPNNPDKLWIKDVYAKSTKQAIMDTDKAFRKFFKGEAGFPKFHKKKNQDIKMYFVKNDKKTIIQCERHRIKVPTLGWVKLKEKGYIPSHDEKHIIKSGTISQKGDRFYISVLVEISDKEQKTNDLPYSEGIGIDLGLKNFATLSNGEVYKSINKSGKIKKLEKQLKRQQRKLSRKYESEKKQIKKGESTRKNIDKQVLRVQKLHSRITNIRDDKQNKNLAKLMKTKPEYIAIEDLNVKGMMKNKHLSKAVQKQSFYTFRSKLEKKCRSNHIELRVVDRYYPSSKICHHCGHKKVNLKLSDRTYYCEECGYKADRDYNASLNLRDTLEYKVIA